MSNGMSRRLMLASLVTGVASVSVYSGGAGTVGSLFRGCDRRPGPKVDGFESHWIETARMSLPYRLYLPDTYSEDRRYPIVLTLHGSNKRGCDNVSQLENAVYYTGDAVQDIEALIILAPQCPKSQTWASVAGWNERDRPQLEVTLPMSGAIAALDTVISEYAVDTNRQYVAGFSMGGYGTWDAITRYPDRFAAATPMSGGGSPELADRVVGADVWAFHGENDTVVPVSASREMIEAMFSAGLCPRYSEFNGGHEPPPQMETDAVAKWMLGTSRPA